MNQYLCSNIMRAIDEGGNKAYLLNKADSFLESEWREMKNKDYLIPCMKTRQNGHIKLIYLTEGKQTLADSCIGMSFRNFLTIIEKMIGILLDINNEKLFSFVNLDMTFSDILIDPETERTVFIYIPVQGEYKGLVDVETEFRSLVIRQIQITSSFAGDQADRVCQVLADTSKDMSFLQTYLREQVDNKAERDDIFWWWLGKQDDSKVEMDDSNELEEDYSSRTIDTKYLFQDRQKLYLTPLNNSLLHTFEVYTAEFVLGKNPDQVQGVIPVSTVSRQHCKITFSKGYYYVEDMGSKNGTFLNGVRMEPNQKKRLKSQDELQLAKEVFRVSF